VPCRTQQLDLAVKAGRCRVADDARLGLYPVFDRHLAGDDRLTQGLQCAVGQQGIQAHSSRYTPGSVPAGIVRV